ncbi:VWA domain-containing protein [Halobaculum sp. D14]|uniref:VWA domain-containing protein n=1 Tax=Halobaculum sp. D14 TaxID=3421642 RepID=UPI003EB8D8C5
MTADGGADGAVAVDDHVRESLVAFVRALRRDGAAVPANAARTAARALVEVGLADRDRARDALRAALLTDRRDFESFDWLFTSFWHDLAGGPGGMAGLVEDVDGGLAPLDQTGREESASVEDEGGDGDGGSDDDATLDERSAGGELFDLNAADDDPAGDDEAETSLYSPAGSAEPVRGHGVAEPVGLDASFRALTDALAGLPGRRFDAGGDRVDVRRALRSSVGTGGTVVSVPTRSRRRSAVSAVLLVDVSRSVLDTVDRGFLVDFLRRARRDWRDVRVFFFDESLREVTAAVDAPSAAAAMDALDAAEAAWGGGTRIGGALAELRERAPDAVDRRTTVFVVSDGLETGDVDELERGLAWVARRAPRVLWLNPLAAAATYEPTARGMAAALPYVDGLFAFTGPDDVADAAAQLARYGTGSAGLLGYERRAGAAPGPNRPPTASPRDT